MLKVGVLVSGGGTNLQAILDAMDRGDITNARVDFVISNNPGAYALERARNHGVEAECISPKSYDSREAFHSALLARLQEKNPDLIVLAGYLVAIPPEIVDAFPNRIINIHPSLIPSFCGVGYYGLRVHEAVLKRGVKVTGATVHFVDKGTDTGPILLQKAVKIPENLTAGELQRLVMEKAEWKILPKAIQLIANDKITVTDGIVSVKE
ncbi:MAG: phosphoribosylglycinamide formyltransferase [Clostridiales bacterium]|nr:phosphoribosylglycinamide formyltransferase [Clostridiales bacterium]